MEKASAEVGIVGAGPIGLELAVALKRAGISTLHFESRQIGHTISWFAPQTRFFSSADRLAIAGVPLQTVDQSKPTREEYLTYLRDVVQQFDLQIRAYEAVLGIERKEGGFCLSTHKGLFNVRKLVMATGGTAGPRKLDIPGEGLRHVSHYFKDPHIYFRRRLLIVGGRNSAVEAALRCHRAGAFVSMSYRRDKLDTAAIKYWLLPEITSLLETGKIGEHFLTTPVKIEPEQVTLKRENGKTYKVAASVVLLLTGYEADMSLCRQLGVELKIDSQAPQFDPATMETNVPGLYVAGTATAGTQGRFTVFIENCHVHVERIMAALTGAAAPADAAAPTPTEKLES
jgi:thioredoxin reductase (NADPH)